MDGSPHSPTLVLCARAPPVHSEASILGQGEERYRETDAGAFQMEVPGLSASLETQSLHFGTGQVSSSEGWVTPSTSCPQIKDTVTMDAGRANKEVEILRKQCKALCQELKEALQEADVAKCRRDWAFQERDKIVAERDSIR